MSHNQYQLVPPAPVDWSNLDFWARLYSRAITTITGRLILRQVLSVVIALAFGVTAYETYGHFYHVTKTVGKDSVPSIVAAEQIRSTLTEAHANALNIFLLSSDADIKKSKATYEESIQKVHDKLLTAAQNITYGDDERKPILAMLDELSVYERLITAAFIEKNADNDLMAADELMHDKIIPAAIQLDRANYQHLNRVMEDEKSKNKEMLWIFLGMAMVVIIAIGESQYVLYSTFKRIINIPLMIGTLIFLMGVIVFTVKIISVEGEVKAAKENAFDSVHALAQAEAVGYDANAEESLYLILSSEKDKAASTAKYQVSATELFSDDSMTIDKLPKNWSGLKGLGYLGSELANITFDGESELAVKTLKYWFDYVRIDKQIRVLEVSGKHADAIRLCLGGKEGESNWAFTQFYKALEETLQLNDRYFQQGINVAFDHLSVLIYLVFILPLVIIVASIAGIQQRLTEFA